MKPTLSLHGIARLELTEVQHFPQSGQTKEFWQRELIAVDVNGDSYCIGLFSFASKNSLKLPEETCYNPSLDEALNSGDGTYKP